MRPRRRSSKLKSGSDPVPEDAGAERLVAASFLVTLVSGLMLLGLYVAGGQTQLEGILLFLCLGGLGFGIVVWAHRLLPNRDHIELRHSLAPTEAAAVDLTETIAAERGVTRRTLLTRLLFGAFAGLGAALAIPIFSLGPAPGRSLFVTPWKNGSRLVDAANQPVRAEQIPVGGVLTVFPDGSPGSPDGQTLLIHVEPELLALPADRASWAPDGFVAYSKVCTHAGCPVGLYRADAQQLDLPLPPVDVRRAPRRQPDFGAGRAAAAPAADLSSRPTARSVALGDFPEPVGPSFWDLGA